MFFQLFNSVTFLVFIHSVRVTNFATWVTTVIIKAMTNTSNNKANTYSITYAESSRFLFLPLIS